MAAPTIPHKAPTFLTFHALALHFTGLRPFEKFSLFAPFLRQILLVGDFARLFNHFFYSSRWKLVLRRKELGHLNSKDRLSMRFA